MNLFKVAPRWETLAPALLEASSPGFGQRLAIDASDGLNAVLTSSFGLAAGQPLPLDVGAAQGIEVHGVLFQVAPAVLPSGEHVLRGSLPIASAASLLPVPPLPEGAQDPPAPEGPARQKPPPAVAGDVILAKSEQLAAARRELAGATARLAAITREEKGLRQQMENLEDERGEIASAMPSLQAAADEHARTLAEALAAERAGG